MAISVDPLTHVIFVPKNDLTLVQSTPTEIRELDLNWFRMQLKAWEASEEGMPQPKTHKHNTEVELGGLTYARVIEILDPYSITFEDGQYAVNLTHANSNVGDKVNVNQVSVRSHNSAGLISSPDIEYSSYNGGVTVDLSSPYDGTLFPVGTPRQPVNNLSDALLIAQYRGFTLIYLTGDVTLDSGTDFHQMSFQGESPSKTKITIADDANVTNCEFYDAEVTGILDGGNVLTNCLIHDLNYINGYIEQCIIGSGTITLGGGQESVFLDCWAGDVVENPPVIDLGGSGQTLVLQNFNGFVKLTNKSGPEEVNISLNAGWIELDSTITEGSGTIVGVGAVTDNSGPNFSLDTTYLVSPPSVANAVLDGPLSAHQVSGSLGEAVDIIKKIEGGRWRRTGTQMVFYAEDNSTEIARFNLYKSDGTLADESDSVFERRRV